MRRCESMETSTTISGSLQKCCTVGLPLRILKRNNRTITFRWNYLITFCVVAVAIGIDTPDRPVIYITATEIHWLCAQYAKIYVLKRWIYKWFSFKPRGYKPIWADPTDCLHWWPMNIFISCYALCHHYMASAFFSNNGLAMLPPLYENYILN